MVGTTLWRAALTACIAFAASGCGAQPHPVPAPLSSECVPGVGQPIRARVVLRALRAHGFVAGYATSDCLSVFVADISSHSGDTDIYCGVRPEPIYVAKYGPGFHALPKTEMMAGHWVVDNVECALYAQGDPSSSVTRLKAAMFAMRPKK
jgi:hypothetical protein